MGYEDKLMKMKQTKKVDLNKLIDKKTYSKAEFLETANNIYTYFDNKIKELHKEMSDEMLKTGTKIKKINKKRKFLDKSIKENKD